MERYKRQLSKDIPNIGYTARDALLNYTHYSKALRESGANPILFDDDVADFEDFIDSVDAMLFTGGDDVAPELYGETAGKDLGPYDLDWDKKELELVRIARKIGLPVLGNCRGLQVINVALGGTLYQDLIDDHVTTFNHRIYPRTVDVTVHDDFIDKESRLANILDKATGPHDANTVRLKVNSSHHQAVRNAGEDLKVTTRAFDDVIEGVEIPGHLFFIGVQWHPEDLTSNHVLHRELVKAAHAWRASHS